MQGTSFGKYCLIALLGRGGMGEVWRALDTDTDRIVALKVLAAHLADDETFQKRFRREAHAAAGLSEPHVIPIHGYGEIEGRLYVDMRLVAGRELDAVVREGPLAPLRAVVIVEQIASALHAAHQVGLLHRDVKPSNILLTDTDFAYLIDFGIARLAGETGLTSTGSTLGTWSYMAPERFGAREADHRSDVYALTCVLHQCLTGQLPFAGHSVEQQVVAHLTTPPPKPSAINAVVPPSFDNVIAVGMAKDPDQRYASAKEFAEAARAALHVANAARQPAPGDPQRQQFQPPRTDGTPSATLRTTPAPVALHDSHARTQQAPAVHHHGQFAPRHPVPPVRATTLHPARRWLLVAAALAAIAVLAAIPMAVHQWHLAAIRPVSAPTASSPATVSSAPPGSPHYGQPVRLPFFLAEIPLGIAVDADRNVYVSQPEHLQVLMLGAGSTSVTPFDVKCGMTELAAHAAGQVYGTCFRSVEKLTTATGSQATTLPFGETEGLSLAVDIPGNIYTTNYPNNERQIIILRASNHQRDVLTVPGTERLLYLAADSTGKVYLPSDDTVLRMTPGWTAPEVLPFQGLVQPYSIAVDPADNVYVDDYKTKKVLRLDARTHTQTELPLALEQPGALAVDDQGNVYIADDRNLTIIKLPIAQ